MGQFWQIEDDYSDLQGIVHFMPQLSTQQITTMWVKENKPFATIPGWNFTWWDDFDSEYQTRPLPRNWCMIGLG